MCGGSEACSYSRLMDVCISQLVAWEQTRRGRSRQPLSSEYGTCKTVKARIWPWREPFSEKVIESCSCPTLERTTQRGLSRDFWPPFPGSYQATVSGNYQVIFGSCQATVPLPYPQAPPYVRAVLMFVRLLCLPTGLQV